MVTSREMSDCHSPAALLTSTVAPVVSDARNVMMATTARARDRKSSCAAPVAFRNAAMSFPAFATAWRICPDQFPSFHSSIVNVQPAVMQHQSPCIVLIHECDVVGRNDDEVPDLLSSMEQSQESLRQCWIDVSGGLVRQQELRSRDHRACNRRSLLFTAREYWGQRPHPLAEANPVAATRSPHRDSSPPASPSPAAARRRSRRWSCGLAGGSPGTRSRSDGATLRPHRAKA